MNITFVTAWEVFQDVHDIGESLRIYEGNVDPYRYSHLLSPWENVERMTYLQKLFSPHPYYGRALRSFNTAPWWYRSTFTAERASDHYEIEFACVDYYCRVWVNGQYIGSHEGYQVRFAMDISSAVRPGENHIYVKVWSPWDTTVDPGWENLRFFSVRREMLKGTYEHADGFIQRDVNPVGIVGLVSIKSWNGPFLKDLRARCISGKSGQIEVELSAHGKLSAAVEIVGPEGELCLRDIMEVSGTTQKLYRLAHPVMWSTWDQGMPALYTITAIPADPEQSSLSRRVGLVDSRLERTPDKTAFYLNDRRVFLRGTTYFPDVYFADRPAAQVKSDLLRIREAGFNAVRVHVHVEQEAFYDLCDELGLVVFQDTDFSWNHPTDSAWVKEKLALFSAVVRRLRDHACIGCWILLNEPDKWKTSIVNQNGCSLSEILQMPDSISQAIGIPLLERLREEDPVHSYIRASYNEEDPESGDSHNYLGSLRGQDTQYTDIDGTTEKLVTEFGMDAPGCLENLSREPDICHALRMEAGNIEHLQLYQYKLLKYYIEHYRAQRFQPCSGYFQFMFVDLCPQSFYGVLDWWGTPKKSWDALAESNQPVAVMAVREKDTSTFSLLLVNDLSLEKKGTVTWSFHEGGAYLAGGSLPAVAVADALTKVSELPIPEGLTENSELRLTFSVPGEGTPARNLYLAPFWEMRHVQGHPAVINNELGVRLFRTM